MYFDKFVPGTVRYVALVLPQPLASNVARGEVTNFMLSENSTYRGQVLVCDEKECLALAYLAGTMPVNNLYEYSLRKARRVIEMPMKMTPGFHSIYVPEDDIMEYPDPKNVKRWLKK